MIAIGNDKYFKGKVKFRTMGNEIVNTDALVVIRSGHYELYFPNGSYDLFCKLDGRIFAGV